MMLNRPNKIHRITTIYLRERLSKDDLKLKQYVEGEFNMVKNPYSNLVKVFVETADSKIVSNVVEETDVDNLVNLRYKNKECGRRQQISQ